MNIRVACLLCWLSLLVATHPAMTQCNLISALPPQDIDILDSDVDFADKTEAWFATSQLTDVSADNQTNARGIVPLGSMLADIGFSGNSSERVQRQREFRSRWESDQSFRQRFRAGRIRLNAQLVQALRDCLTQTGLHVWIEPGGAPDEFLFRTLYNPSGDPSFVRVVSFEHSSNVSCRNPLRPGARLTSAGHTLLCARKDSAGSTIVLNASVRSIEHSPLRLPPILQDTVCAELECDSSPKLNQAYRIRVYTSDRDHAGTRARVYITLIGSTSTLGERQYDRAGVVDHRQGHSVTYQTPVTRNLGNVCRIRLRHDNNGPGPGWHVREVVVDDYNGRSWRFPVNRWLARGIGDGRISIALTSSSEGCYSSGG